MEEEKKAANGGENTGKTFTQEEVNQIISNRLKEEREKLKKEQDASFMEREKNLAAREMRLNAIDRLQEKGLPASLVDAINCSDEDAINKSIEILANYKKSELQGTQKAEYIPVNGNRVQHDAVRDAMGL